MYQLMIVDDDFFVLEGMKNEIDWENLNVHIAITCSNGREALQALEDMTIDILLTDVKMPLMDGLDLTKEALARQPNLQIVIISGYSEFEYAQKAIKFGVFDYLLKPVTVEMIQTVFRRLVEKMDEQHDEIGTDKEEWIPLLNQKIYYDIISGVQNEQTEREIQKKKRFSRFQIAVIRVDLRSQDDSLKQKNAAKQILELLKSRGHVQVNFIPLLLENAELYILFSLLLSQEQKLVENFLKEVQRDVYEQLGVTISIGLSSNYKDLRKSPDNLEKARLAVERRFYLGYNQIIYFDHLKIPSNMDVSSLAESRSSLLEALENWDYRRIMEELNILEEILQQKIQLNMEQIRRIGIELYSMLQSVHNHYSPLTDSECKMYDVAGEKIHRAGTLEELFDLLRNLYTEVFSTWNTGNTKRHKVVPQVLTYVKENINTNLSLAKIAQKVYMSPNYLGKIFKEEMGVGFNEYLVQYRMETAKKLLKSGKYKVYEVSSMVGYKNPNYFSKVFKEYTGGIWPSDYMG